MSDPTRERILDSLSEEEIFRYLRKKSKSVQETQNTDPAITGQNRVNASQKYYLGRKIPGSTKRCNSCGQTLVNDEDHALALNGTDEDFFTWLKVKQGGESK